MGFFAGIHYKKKLLLRWVSKEVIYTVWSYCRWSSVMFAIAAWGGRQLAGDHIEDNEDNTCITAVCCKTYFLNS